MELPLGKQGFEALRKKNCYYVDKTRYIWELTSHGDDYFLSRPRRFGKSLLVSTLECLFEGKKELFKGLYIYDKWDWSQKYPVLTIDLGGKEYTNENDLERRIFAFLDRVEKKYNIVVSGELKLSEAERMQNILEHIYTINSKTEVVVLIDEYDKPLLDVLEDKEISKKNQSTLRGFYSIFKASHKFIRFHFVTGITMFSKSTVFTGFNHLIDISLKPEYSSICGYTDKELDTVFEDEIKNFDRDEIRKWYNGYSWLGEEKVYNPHGILKLFSNKEFEYWWLEDGVPHYLYFYLIQKKVRPLQLENCLVSRQNLIKSNVENVKVKSLYFQSGFLSIQDKIRKNNRTYYRLDYPNFEVRESFNSGFWEYITQDRVDDECQNMLAKYLKNNEFEEFVGHLCVALEGVPYQWNPIEDSKSYFDYEYCYSRFLYAGLSSTNLDINAERSTIMGRCDFAVTYGDQVFIFELKMAKNKKERERMLDSAMKQIKTRRYGESYKKSKKLIHLIALVFGREEKNLIGWRHEMLI